MQETRSIALEKTKSKNSSEELKKYLSQRSLNTFVQKQDAKKEDKLEMMTTESTHEYLGKSFRNIQILTLILIKVASHF